MLLVVKKASSANLNLGNLPSDGRLRSDQEFHLCAKQLSMAGLEPATYGLEVHRATFAPHRKGYRKGENFGLYNSRYEFSNFFRQSSTDVQYGRTGMGNTVTSHKVKQHEKHRFLEKPRKQRICFSFLRQ